MEATVKLDDVLDLVSMAQKDLAKKIDLELQGTRSHRLLWEEYKRLSGLYDSIRRVAK